MCQLTNGHERGITLDKYMYNDVKLCHRMCLIVMISFRLYTHLYHGRYTKVDTTIIQVANETLIHLSHLNHSFIYFVRLT